MPGPEACVWIGVVAHGVPLTLAEFGDLEQKNNGCLCCVCVTPSHTFSDVHCKRTDMHYRRARVVSELFPYFFFVMDRVWIASRLKMPMLSGWERNE